MNSTGMRRLTLSQEDKDTRDWLVKSCRELGCEVKIDSLGNIFAIRPGTLKDKKPIGLGSHLDTQPAGKSTCHHRPLARIIQANSKEVDATMVYWVYKLP